ncbi:DUF4345 domain-containing protein [Nocardiopsis alba]|uniref:DUF4345 domain-containing protein n=1 Tax=Nocardiopsis alba TaxID=53437 RepID=UPI0033D4081F
MRSLRSFQVLLFLLALFVTVAGTMNVLFGTVPLPGDTSVSPVVDSNYRFFSAIFLAMGIMLLWIVPRPLERDRSLALRWVCGAVLLGGLSRILSLFVAGIPAPLSFFLMGMELVVPPVLFLWHRSLSSRSVGPAAPAENGGPEGVLS